MLKTVKNGSWILVDLPPPVFFFFKIPTFSRFFSGNFPDSIYIKVTGLWMWLGQMADMAIGQWFTWPPATYIITKPPNVLNHQLSRPHLLAQLKPKIIPRVI